MLLPPLVGARFVPTEGSNHVQLSRCYGAQIVIPPVAGAPFCEFHETHSPAPSIPQFYKLLLSPLVGARFWRPGSAPAGAILVELVPVEPPRWDEESLV